MNKKNHLSRCIAFCVGLTAASAAYAQPYSSIVAFGDSLTDSGQFPDSDPASPVLPTSSGLLPLQSLRVTNRVGPTFLAPEPYGKVAIQYVAEDLGLGSINASTNPVPGLINGAFAGNNFAIAGNTSDQIRNSITAPLGSVLRNPADGSILNQRNGYLVDNPQADPSALYYINGGANDLLGFSQNPMTTPEVAAGTAMANIAAGVEALADAGANYIMVANIPDIGLTALAEAQAAQASALAGDPAAGEAIKASLSGLTSAYNATLNMALSQIDANIIPFDLNGLITEVSEDPSRFGFSSATTCFFGGGSTPCIEDPNVGLTSGSPNPNALVFSDGIHPSTAAQRTIADYQVGILMAPAETSLLPIIGLVSVESDLRRASNALNVTRNVDALGDLQVNVTIDSSKNRFYNANYGRGLEGDSVLFAVDGILDVSESWKVGLSASITSSELDGRQTASNYETENIGLNLIAGYHKGRYQADLVLNATNLRYGTITRHAPVGADSGRVENGDTEGSATGIYLNAAYDISFENNNWYYGPKLILAAIDVDVKGYTEYSNRVTALGFDDQEYGSDFVQPSLFAQYLSEDKVWSFSATLGIRAELGQANEDLGMRVKSQSFLDFSLPGYQQQDKESVVGDASLTYMPTQNARMSVQYRGQSDNNGYDSLSISGTYNF